jgi:hypothetical protein
MKYILNFETEADYLQHIKNDFIRPHIALFNDTDEVVFEGENIFPIYIETQKYGDKEYRLSATTQTIALADYFLKNAVYDGLASYDLSIPSGCIFIDGAEVTRMSAPGDANVTPEFVSYWHSRSDKYPSGWWETFIYLSETPEHQKGDILIYNDF